MLASKSSIRSAFCRCVVVYVLCTLFISSLLEGTLPRNPRREREASRTTLDKKVFGINKDDKISQESEWCMMELLDQGRMAKT